MELCFDFDETGRCSPVRRTRDIAPHAKQITTSEEMERASPSTQPTRCHLGLETSRLDIGHWAAGRSRSGGERGAIPFLAAEPRDWLDEWIPGEHDPVVRGCERTTATEIFGPTCSGGMLPSRCLALLTAPTNNLGPATRQVSRENRCSPGCGWQGSDGSSPLWGAAPKAQLARPASRVLPAKGLSSSLGGGETHDSSASMPGYMYRYPNTTPSSVGGPHPCALPESLLMV